MIDRTAKLSAVTAFLGLALASALLVATGCGKAPDAAAGKQKEPAAPAAPAKPSEEAIAAASSSVSPGLAAGKDWVASSALAGYKKSGKIENLRSDDIFFHTLEEENPWVEIDLGAATKISQVSLKNRVNCCGEREVPTVVELSADRKSWTEVARQDKPFLVWEPTFPAQDARYVRARAPKRTYFHFAQMGCGLAQASPAASSSSPTTSSTR